MQNNNDDRMDVDIEGVEFTTPVASAQQGPAQLAAQAQDLLPYGDNPFAIPAAAPAAVLVNRPVCPGAPLRAQPNANHPLFGGRVLNFN